MERIPFFQPLSFPFMAHQRQLWRVNTNDISNIRRHFPSYFFKKVSNADFSSVFWWNYGVLKKGKKGGKETIMEFFEQFERITFSYLLIFIFRKLPHLKACRMWNRALSEVVWSSSASSWNRLRRARMSSFKSRMVAVRWGVEFLCWERNDLKSRLAIPNIFLPYLGRLLKFWDSLLWLKDRWLSENKSEIYRILTRCQI